MESTASRTLYLIRHGETDWNAKRLLQGRRDIPLNSRGRVQALETGLCLKWLLGSSTDLDFIASPLVRARETMEIIRHQLGLESLNLRTDARLLEIDFGEWEGSSWQHIAEQDPQRFAARQADPFHYIPPGGENYPMVFRRVQGLLGALERDTVLVAHAGVLRCCLALLTGVDQGLVPGLEIPQDQVLMIRGQGFAWMRACGAPNGNH